MATKSICKNINIKNKTLTRGLVTALENAIERKGKDVVLSKAFEEVKGENIKNLFGVK